MGNTPYWLRCPRCVRAAGRFTGAVVEAHQDLEVTGKRVPNHRGGGRSRRTSDWRIEVRHMRCGHVFSTTHKDAEFLYDLAALTKTRSE